jgi:hypothetical protein
MVVVNDLWWKVEGGRQSAVLLDWDWIWGSGRKKKTEKKKKQFAGRAGWGAAWGRWALVREHGLSGRLVERRLGVGE